MADRALIQAAGTLARSEMPVNIAGEFMKTFMPAVEKAEKERQAVQNEVATYMSSLKSDIDFTSLTPEMEKEVRRYLTESRNEFNELANKVARIEDHSSEEYQNSINRMNDIQREFATLAGELTTYNQEKINTADMFNQHTYSDGWAMGHPKEFALHKNIYGLSEQGMSPVSIKNGHLFFGTEDGEVRYSNIKAIPGKATAAIETVLSGAARASRSKVALTQEEINQQTYVLNQAFQDPNVFASVLFDAPEGTLPLMQVQEEYIKARDNGTLEDVMPQLINDAVGAIVNGYETTAAQSAQAYQDSQNTKKAPQPVKEVTIRPEFKASFEEMQKFENKVNANPQARLIAGRGKTWYLGPKDKPTQIRVKLDPATKKWVYFDARAAVRSEYDTIEQLTQAYPLLFFK